MESENHKLDEMGALNEIEKSMQTRQKGKDHLVFRNQDLILI